MLFSFNSEVFLLGRFMEVMFHKNQGGVNKKSSAEGRLLPVSSALTPHVLFAGNQAGLKTWGS